MGNTLNIHFCGTGESAWGKVLREQEQQPPPDKSTYMVRFGFLKYLSESANLASAPGLKEKIGNLYERLDNLVGVPKYSNEIISTFIRNLSKNEKKVLEVIGNSKGQRVDFVQ